MARLARRDDAEHGWQAVPRTAAPRCRAGKIPVIVFSAHDDVAKIARTLEADDYLAKPFDASELVDAVARCARASPDRRAVPA
ncbi:MAG: response regulator [Deltaproteobacteria bacterium]|nr:MAG: response regulator [Deltaproteobacteria bacterium]TMQ19695.1 MAG: response regulator [Deltaproteobacteria bacterium]